MSHTLHCAHCAQSSACLGPNLDSKVHFGGCKLEQKGVNVYPKLGGANGEKTNLMACLLLASLAARCVFMSV